MEAIKVSVVEFGDRKHFQLQYKDPITGRKKTKSSGVVKSDLKRDRTAAEREAAKWEAELREGRYHAPNRITWEEFRDRYETEKLPSLADGTADRAGAALNWVETILNPSKLADLTEERLSHFQAKMRDAGLKEATIAGNLAHLRSALKWDKSMKMLHTIPTVQMPKRAKGSRMMKGRPITTEEFERMIKAAATIRPRDTESWQRLLTGLWLSGLRLSEALKLSWNGDGELAIDLTGKHPRMRIWADHEKGHQDRLLPITPDFAEWLLKTPEAKRTGPVLALNGLLNGEPITDKRVSRIISEIGEKAAVVVSKADGKFASAHDLRRAYGTRWSKKVMPAVLKRLMRHSSIETTMKYYVEQEADDVAADL
jgi:integrase